MVLMESSGTRDAVVSLVVVFSSRSTVSGWNAVQANQNVSTCAIAFSCSAGERAVHGLAEQVPGGPCLVVNEAVLDGHERELAAVSVGDEHTGRADVVAVGDLIGVECGGGAGLPEDDQVGAATSSSPRVRRGV